MHPATQVSYIAPAGTPLPLADIVRGLGSIWTRPDLEADFGQELCRVGGGSRAWTFASGKAAMAVGLRALARSAGPGRDRVIIPAYTCYSVAAAIERAQLVPVPCDIDPHSLSFDLDHLTRLRSGAVLAIVTANLFGIPNELSMIEDLAHRWGVYLLDDAAQALGATVDGRQVGAFGDAGLFSFDKGKNISTIHGGALVGRSGTILDALEMEYELVAASRGLETCFMAATVPLYSLLLRPTLFGLVRKLPMLYLGETLYEPDFPIARLTGSAQGLALIQLNRLSELQGSRIAKAEALRQSLNGIRGLRFVTQARTARPVFPRFPVLATSRELRDRLVASFEHAGVGASSFYPHALVDVPQVVRRMPRTTASFAGARMVADTLLTLPTHAYCPPDLALRLRELAVTVIRE